MRINRNRIQNEKLPLSPIFFAGTLVGIVIMNLGKSILLENTGLLDEYALYHMKYMTVDSSALFYYVLRIRLKTVAILIIFATTYLGLIVCMATVFWYGFSAGAFLSALLLRYGMKGGLFAILGVFPQYIFYMPAMVALLLWCVQLNKSIYFKTGVVADAVSGMPMPKRLFRLVGILGGVLLGCLSESFINPRIMLWLLKNF